MSQVIHIADTDALIALINTKDAHHATAKTVVTKAAEQEDLILFPSTVIVETITTFHYKLKNPFMAKAVADQITASGYFVVPVDEEILKIAADIYDPTGHRKNTMFDAVVAATAKKQGTNVIFSFDKWYKKLGFTLSKEL